MINYYLSLRSGTINGITFSEKEVGDEGYWRNRLGIEDIAIVDSASFFFKKLNNATNPIRVNGRWGKGHDEVFDVVVSFFEGKAKVSNYGV